MVDQTILRAAIVNLDDDDDAHWTNKGQPDLRALGEMVGAKVSRSAQVVALDRWRHQPTEAEDVDHVDAMGFKPVDIKGCDPIEVMEALVATADPAYLRNNGEMGQVLNAYRAQRGAILERRERHRQRWDGEQKQARILAAA